MKEWMGEAMKSSDFKRASSSRLLVGHIGTSASEIIHEVGFNSLADWESALKQMPTPNFKKFSEELAPYVVPGSQHWTVLRVVD
jgi:hypothetical protein